MATLYNIAGFRVFRGIIWLFFMVFWENVVGDTVHLMSATSNPYGGTQVGTSFMCLLNSPDTGVVNSISRFRHVMRGADAPYNTLALPVGTGSSSNSILQTIILPGSAEAQGMYFCEATSRGLTTRVPVTILASYRFIQPANGQFTITANVGEPTILTIDIQYTPEGANANTDIIWEKQGARSEDFIMKQTGGTALFFLSVSVSDAGVYATYWRGYKTSFTFSLIRLVVRGCAEGRWGPPSCTGVCDNCYNGGICDDKTGECVCRPGFIGPNCLTACTVNTFGWNCEHQCGVNSVPSCEGSVFCMPDPVGCSCMAGYMGTDCNTVCSNGMFGARCTENCNCADGFCNTQTGECAGVCYDGWSGTSCQIPDTCTPGYYGTMCTEKCYCDNCDKTTGCLDEQCFDGFWGMNCESECHCLNGAACDKATGQCDADIATGLSLCAPGYVSSTGINLDNCQQNEGCFGSCTKTCHCSFGADDCDPGTGVCPSGCKQGWNGPSCQTGIADLSFTKVNAGQLLDVICVVTGDAIIPASNQVSLLYNDEQGASLTVNSREFVTRGTFMVASFDANPPVGLPMTCVLQIVNGNQVQNAFASVTGDYYFDLPQLFAPPTASDVSATSLTLKWNAWGDNPADTGDGPVIAYKIYEVMSQIEPITVSALTRASLSVAIEPLTPSTLHRFYVSCVREGEGGEGEPSQFTIVTTLPVVTQPPPTTRAVLTPARTTPVASTTVKPSTMIARITTSGAVDPATGTTRSGGVGPGDGTTIPTTDSGAKTTAVYDKNPSKHLSGQLPIIIAVIVTIIVLLIFIITLIWFIKRRRSRTKRYPPSSIASEAEMDRWSTVLPISPAASVADSNGIDNQGLELDEAPPQVKPRPFSQPAPPIGTETPPPLRGRPKSAEEPSTGTIQKRLRIPVVNIKDYPMYVKRKRQSSDLKVEWESLPKDLARPTTIAKKSENKGKNRYRNVVAYDHSRVVLEPLEEDPNSDYINACYIKGIKTTKAYIASQGPTEKSVPDYWRMIWQENISVMVMACNLFEEGRPKCNKYWPEKGAPVEYHGIMVSLESEEKKEDFYILRKFCISKEGEEGARELLQFHYTTWPDKDVPRHCTPVLKFIQVFVAAKDNDSPFLIHCSAGAGRTGAIIAIHAMMELAEEKAQVDIYNFVFSMRNSRPNIVQTASQYAFIHDAMLEHLFCKNTFVPADTFVSRLKMLKEQNPETGNNYIADEYEILSLVSPNLIPDKTRGSLKEENAAKIRSPSNLPVDSNRPYLMTPRGDDDQSPYINAVYMDGYKKKDLFISTQMPVTNTVVDLWRMMYDYNCTSIVQLNAMDPSDKDCPQFWPDAGTNEYGPFTVSLMDKQATPDFVVRSLQLVYTKRDVKSPLPVRHFQYMTWPLGDEQPVSSHGLLQLISAVEKWQKTLETPGPIVVMCMNAAGRSGAFCAIQSALDQIREEQGVDVLQSVKQLRIHRTNMVDTTAKYLFCYETILEYLKAFDDYDGKEAYGYMPDFSPDFTQSKGEASPGASGAATYENIASIGGVPSSDAAAEEDKPAEGATAASAAADNNELPAEKGKKPQPPVKPKGNKKSSFFKRSSKKKKSVKEEPKKEQQYQNIMFDTKL